MRKEVKISLICFISMFFVFLSGVGCVPKLEDIEIGSSSIAVFSDNEDDKAVVKLKDFFDEKNILVFLTPEYFNKYKEQSMIIVLGVRNSKTEKIVKKIVDDFDKNQNYFTAKEDMFSEKQQIVIFYAQTNKELIDAVADFSPIDSKEPQREEAKQLATSQAFGLKDNAITAKVTECVPAYTSIEFDKPVLNNAFNKQGILNTKYARIQFFSPFASYGSISGLAAGSASDVIQTITEGFVEDLKDTNLADISIVCDKCGQSFEIKMNEDDYTYDLLRRSEMDSWTNRLSTDMCTECPGSNVSLSVKIIDPAETIQNFVTEKVSAKYVLDDLLGVYSDMTWDDLPKKFSFTQTCPDYIPRIAFDFLVPVFIDKNNKIMEYEFNVSTSRPVINWDNVGSYSAPKLFYSIPYPTGVNSLAYQVISELDVYYLAEVSSFPAGIIPDYKFYFGNPKLITAPWFAVYNGKIHKLRFWAVNDNEQRNGATSVVLNGEYSKAVAYYVDTGIYAGEPDLVIYQNETSVEKEGGFYKIKFKIHNIGTREYGNNPGEENKLLTRVLVGNKALDKLLRVLEYIQYDYVIQANESVEFEAKYPEEDICPKDEGNKEQTIYIYTDYSDMIKESNENNNAVEIKIKPQKPDLKIAGFEMSPKQPKFGDTVEIKMTIVNVGTATAETAVAEAVARDENWGKKLITSLSSGAAGKIVFDKKMESCGKYKLNASISDVAPEDADLSNNKGTFDFEVSCEGISCDKLTNPELCATATCETGKFCVWNTQNNKCECKPGMAGTCDELCGELWGHCAEKCYEGSYLHSMGYKWCNDYAYGFVCCCQLPIT